MVLRESGKKLAETTTDENGFYKFENLPAGEYTVVVSKLPGASELTQTFDLDGKLNGMTPVTLGEGEDRTDVDFGYMPPAPVGSIGDFVWLDVNADGKQN